MNLILYGDAEHQMRCTALAGTIPGSGVTNVNGPALKMSKIDTLTFWAHGDKSSFCKLTSAQFVKKVQDWVKLNPTIKTVEIITCNSRHGGEVSKRVDGEIEVSWVKSYTDQVKAGLRKLGLTIKALPMGMSMGDAHRWSVLMYSGSTQTWLYVTANGVDDKDMWVGVNATKDHDTFKNGKNFALAGMAVKANMPTRKFTLDFGTIADLRKALVTLA